jgi:hypothetical protein
MTPTTADADFEPPTSGYREVPLRNSTGSQTIGYARIPVDVDPPYVLWNGRLFLAMTLCDTEGLPEEDVYTEVATPRVLGPGDVRPVLEPARPFQTTRDAIAARIGENVRHLNARRIP